MPVLPVTRIAVGRHSFAQQILRRGFGRREVQRRELRRQHAAHLLRKRLPEIAGAQPGLDMRHRHAAIERAQRAAKSSGGVALHHHQVRRFFRQHRVERRHNARRRFGQRLPRPHHVQIVVRSNRERLQRLIEQAAMLRRHNDASFEFVGDFQKPARHRRQLDRLGARAQDDRNFQGMDFIGSGSSPVP